MRREPSNSPRARSSNSLESKDSRRRAQEADRIQAAAAVARRRKPRAARLYKWPRRRRWRGSRNRYRPLAARSAVHKWKAQRHLSLAQHHYPACCKPRGWHCWHRRRPGPGWPLPDPSTDSDCCGSRRRTAQRTMQTMASNIWGTNSFHSPDNVQITNCILSQSALD